MIIDQYLSRVLAQVKFKEAHPDIAAEIRAHVDEIVEESRLPSDEASLLAVQRLGDAEALGLQLNEVHRPRLDWVSIGLTSALLVVSVVVAKASGLQLISAVLGLGLGAALTAVRPGRLRNISGRVFGGSAVLLGLSLLSDRWFGGQPYLHWGSINIKIVDLSVVFFVVSLAGILCGPRRNSWTGLLVLFPLGIYLSLGSIYPAFVYTMAVEAMMFVNRRSLGRMWPALTFAVMAVALFGGRDRFYFGYKMEDLYTDFVLFWIGSLSFKLAVGVSALALGLVARLAWMAGQIKNLYGRTMMAAVASVFGVGIVWGLLSDWGMLPIPVTGLNFPLLSYGGSMLVSHLVLLGMAMGWSRRRNLLRID